MLGAAIVARLPLIRLLPGGLGGLRPARVDLRPGSSETEGGLTTFTAGGPALWPGTDITPATLPLLCSIRAFCFCLTDSMDRTCSIAAGSSRLSVKPITTGETGVACSDPARWTLMFSDGWVPLIVTRRLLGGLGYALEGGGALLVSWRDPWNCWLDWADGGVCRSTGSCSCSSLIRTNRGERCLSESEVSLSCLPDAELPPGCARFKLLRFGSPSAAACLLSS